MEALHWGLLDFPGRVILFPFLALIAACWIAYFDVLKGLWVIDDGPGMAAYDGKLQRPVSIGNLWKKLRFEATKVPNPDHEWATKKFAPYLVHPRAHHRLNIWFHCGTVGMLYGFLSRVVGPDTAFLTCLLFAVHPLGTQAIAWISGISYVAGAFLALTGLNVAFLLTDAGWLTTPMGVIAALAIYGFIQWLAVEVMFAMLGMCVVLWWVGLTPFALVAAALALYSGLHAFNEAITLRAKTFKEQNMGRSTTLHWRKLFVALKTLGYYTCFVCWPKRIGIYHTYGYHYETPYIESEDRWLWVGVLIVSLGILGLLYGSIAVQLGIIWYAVFLMLFFNWVTANQFLTERYAWLPTAGLCLIVATYVPVWLLWLLIGIALMRTWAHLPAYYNETQFYMSNMWNFPTSEVALGNLGVTYMARGLVGSALESWFLGLNLNKDYDVCWYNIASAIKQRGPQNLNYLPLLLTHVPQEIIQKAMNDPMKAHLHLARYCLERAATSKLSHFKERWTQEIVELDKILVGSIPVVVMDSAPVVVAGSVPAVVIGS